jgi:hypothetical protein
LKPSGSGKAADARVVLIFVIFASDDLAPMPDFL